MTNMTMPWHNTCPMDHRIYNSGKTFLGHHFCIINLSDLIKCFFTMWLIWPCPSTTTPFPKFMILMILVDPYLVIIIIHVIHPAEKTKKYINFTLVAPKLSHLQGGGNGWVINFTISCLLTLHMLHIPKFGKDWPGNSKEEHVNVQQMSHNNGHEPIAIGHQSDSADLKTQQVKPKQIHRKK